MASPTPEQKLGSLRDLRESGMEPSFVVTGNQPVVIRESLLPRAFEMAEGTVAASFELEDESRGMIGPFCLETIVTDSLEFKVFEISARIVAGSNPFVGGSPYSDINECQLDVALLEAYEMRSRMTASTTFYRDLNPNQVLGGYQNRHLRVQCLPHFQFHQQVHQIQLA